jgi:dynein light intermediate chain 1
VPPNWDSWGKIRVLREGFDVESVNKGWSIDIEESTEPISNGHANGSLSRETDLVPGGAVATYEETIRDPSLDALHAATAPESSGLKPEVSSKDTQSFLAEQLEELDKLRSEASVMDSSRQAVGRQVSANLGLEMGEDGHADEREGKVNEHIGPVQFNMGGIQVDADDMLQRLRVGSNRTQQHVLLLTLRQDRQTYQTPEPTTPAGGVSSPPQPRDEALANFFANLMKRGGESATSSPKPGTS